MIDALAAAAQLGAASGSPVDQPYLLEARQMQALSLAVHIPLVCFGIAFPAMVLFVEGLWLLTGDPVYRAIAKRWSKVMLILFAIGVVTGTILSFELGLLWPRWMERFASRPRALPPRRRPLLARRAPLRRRGGDARRARGRRRQRRGFDRARRHGPRS